MIYLLCAACACLIFLAATVFSLRKTLLFTADRVRELEKRLDSDYYTKHVVARMVSGDKGHVTNHEHDAVLAEKLAEKPDDKRRSLPVEQQVIIELSK